MRACYISRRFSASSERIISQAESICREYAAAGHLLTLRQLYYQFVSRMYMPNTDADYKRLGSVINDARLAGRLDWFYMEDRTRNVAGNAHWKDPADILEVVSRQFRQELWKDQSYRPEIWIEKEALAGVVASAARGLDVDYLSCRGYMSQSEMYSAAQRLRSYIDAGQQPVMIHLGDHDPSGIDMTRDNLARLRMFVCDPDDWCELSESMAKEGGDSSTADDEEIDFTWEELFTYPRPKVIVNRIALNMPQIRQYDPPPNPAKITDSRAQGYIALYGNSSWELDALEPSVLSALMRDAVAEYRDDEVWAESLRVQEKHRSLLVECSRQRYGIAEMLESEE